MGKPDRNNDRTWHPGYILKKTDFHPRELQLSTAPQLGRTSCGLPSLCMSLICLDLAQTLVCSATTAGTSTMWLLLCPEDIVCVWQFSVSGLPKLSSHSSTVISETWEDEFIIPHLRQRILQYLHLNQVWVSVLMSIYWKYELLYGGFRNDLIYGYDKESFVTGLILFLSSRIITVASPLQSITCLAIGSVLQQLCHLWVSSCEESLKANRKVIGYFHDVHETIAPSRYV